MGEILEIHAAPPEDVDPRALEPAPEDTPADAGAEPPAVSVETVRLALDWLFRGEALLLVRAGRADLAEAWPLTPAELDWAAPIIAEEVNRRPQLRRLFRGGELATGTWYGVLLSLHLRRLALPIIQQAIGRRTHGHDAATGAAAAGHGDDAAAGQSGDAAGLA